MSDASKTWNPTQYQYLYRHKSETYYVRFGKRTWKSLRTKTISIARARLKCALEEEEKRLEQSGDSSFSGKLNGAAAIRLRRNQVDNDPSLKTKSKEYWHAVLTQIERTWPALLKVDMAKITPEQCEKWAGDYAKVISASRFNNTLSALNHLFEIAVEKGIRATNPAAKIKRRKLPKKDLSSRLPSREQFSAWVAEIRRSRSRWGHACADLVEFLAYSGLRIAEAGFVRWEHCDFERGELFVVGDPDEATKNSETRRLPMIPALKALLERMRGQQRFSEGDRCVLLVKSATKAMRSACSAVGIERLTHHDLRHLFATSCIEAGVDIPTVAKWLGHKDGGALAMRVYGHLRDEHSLAAAQKVDFGI